MFTAPLSATLRALPAVGDHAKVLALPIREPFVTRCLTALASRAVTMARRAQRDRMIFAVCGACPSCDTYAQTVRIAAQTAGMDTIQFLPATVDGGSGQAARGRSVPARSDYRTVDGTYADAVTASKRHAARVGAAEVTPPGLYGNHGHFAVALVLLEAFGCLPGPPTQLWMPLDDLCAGADVALRLLGWPTTLIAVDGPAADRWPVNASTDHPASLSSVDGAAALPDPAAVWPDTASPAGLGPRRGQRRIVHAGTARIDQARRQLAAAGVTVTAKAALGLAGLLQDDSPSSSSNTTNPTTR